MGRSDACQTEHAQGSADGGRDFAGGPAEPTHGRPVVTILLTSTGKFQSLILAPSLENKIGKTHAPKVR